MSRPDSVKVGAFTFEISWDKNLGPLGAAGMTNPDNQIIGVDPSIAAESQKATLVHEVLHAIWKQTDLVKKYPDEDKESKGERIIHMLEPFLYQFIRENPEVVKWLRSP